MSEQTHVLKSSFVWYSKVDMHKIIMYSSPQVSCLATKEVENY